MKQGPFGSYELLKRLDVGRTAELWVALPRQHGQNERPLLLKCFLPEAVDEFENTESFLQEARRSANLQHPNIVRILASGEVEGTPYLARELVHGESLKSVLRLARSSPSVLTHERALRILASVCEALAFAYHHVDPSGHPLKQLHGQLAARHVLIGTDGVVKVMDFGGGKVTERWQPVRVKPMPGLRDGLAPEQLKAEGVDHRTDLFSAGLLLYELLTGVRPFERDSDSETLFATYKCEIPPPSQVAQVPKALDALVMKALAKAQDDRYQDPRDFQRALEAALTAQGAKPGPESLREMMRHLSGGTGPS